MKKYERIWRLHWVPFCVKRGENPQEYNVVNFVNFLNQVQENSESYATSKGRTAQHGTYKERCAAISGCFELKYPDKQRLSMHPHTRAMASSNRRTAPNVPKYYELPDLSPVLEQRVSECKQFITSNGTHHGFWAQMPITAHRDNCMFLTRLDIGNRSADLAAINRIWSGPYAGLRGNQGRCEITHIRYDFPKNWHSRIRMSEWVSLGDYKCNSPGFRPEYQALCTRSALECYYRRTVSLPIKPTVDLDHPNENKTRLFISVIKQKKLLFTELKASTIAGRIKTVLKNGGVDVDKFQSHVLRHVSINAQIAHGKEVDDVLARACVSNKVFSMFYKLPYKAASSTSHEHIMFSDPDQENQDPALMTLITEQTATTTATTSTVSSRSALRVQSGRRSRKRRRTAAGSGVT